MQSNKKSQLSFSTHEERLAARPLVRRLSEPYCAMWDAVVAQSEGYYTLPVIGDGRTLYTVSLAAQGITSGQILSILNDAT
jgi:hypothetical protein